MSFTSELQTVLKQMSPQTTSQTSVYRDILNALASTNCKRILFDAYQATVLDNAGQLPESAQTKLRLPFPVFWVEFTRPIMVGEQEPEHPYDQLRAALVVDTPSRLIMDDKIYSAHFVQVTLFLTSNWDGEAWELIDRTFRFDLETGWAFCRIQNSRESSDPSELPPEWPDDTYLPAKTTIIGMENRHIGWWERVTDRYAQLISWMLCYMMAKGIEIVAESLSRQQTRSLMRQGKLPQPWHLVRIQSKTSQPRPEIEPQGQHRFRYDVIGHLRFGRHKTKTGYREIVEWVSAHQRGLAHELYIPKTYYVDAGAPYRLEARRYLGLDFKP